jgi:hypothetical protein
MVGYRGPWPATAPSSVGWRGRDPRIEFAAITWDIIDNVTIAFDMRVIHAMACTTPSLV